MLSIRQLSSWLAVLPVYFETYFRRVTLGPVVQYPMPPLAPLQPLPEPVKPNFAPIAHVSPPHPITRPVSRSFSSTISQFTEASIFSNVSGSTVSLDGTEDSHTPTVTGCPDLEKLQSLNLHFYRAFQGVLACREAMYEELKDRIRNKESQLKSLGWDDDEELGELQGRLKFERLCERYSK